MTLALFGKGVASVVVVYIVGRQIVSPKRLSYLNREDELGIHKYIYVQHRRSLFYDYVLAVRTDSRTFDGQNFSTVVEELACLRRVHVIIGDEKDDPVKRYRVTPIWFFQNQT